MATRWGIVGCGRIANDFCMAMKTLPNNNHKVVAIAARDVDDPETFAHRHEIPTSYTCYEELAKNKDIEIVYIAVIHTEHFRLSRLMLENGKHILCEKPLALHTHECREILSLAKDRSLFCMEGLWSRFLPTYVAISDSVSRGELGDVKLVHALAYLPLNHHPRICSRELAGGGLYDMGIYGISLATMIYGERPCSIVAQGELMETGVDLNGCVTLRYSTGGCFQMAYDISVKRPNNYAQIIGTKGHIEMRNPFWSCPDVITPNDHVVLDLPDDKSKYNCVNTEGLKYEMEAARACLQNRLDECPRATHEHSLIIAEILEEIAQQLGVDMPSSNK